MHFGFKFLIFQEQKFFFGNKRLSVVGLGPFDHVTLRQLHWLPIEQCIQYKLCLLVHLVHINIASYIWPTLSLLLHNLANLADTAVFTLAVGFYNSLYCSFSSAILCWHRICFHHVFVCLSIKCYTETAKHRIMQIVLHNNLGTLVFRYWRSWWKINLNGFTLKGVPNAGG